VATRQPRTAFGLRGPLVYVGPLNHQVRVETRDTESADLHPEPSAGHGTVEIDHRLPLDQYRPADREVADGERRPLDLDAKACKLLRHATAPLAQVADGNGHITKLPRQPATRLARTANQLAEIREAKFRNGPHRTAFEPDVRTPDGLPVVTLWAAERRIARCSAAPSVPIRVGSKPACSSAPSRPTAETGVPERCFARPPPSAVMAKTQLPVTSNIASSCGAVYVDCIDRAWRQPASRRIDESPHSRHR
jgi:hypothetical protein